MGRQREALPQRVRRFYGRLLSDGPHFHLDVAGPRAHAPGILHRRPSHSPVGIGPVGLYANVPQPRRAAAAHPARSRRLQLPRATCLITLTWAFLQNAGLPRFDVSWVAPLLIMLWGLGLGIAKQRYQ